MRGGELLLGRLELRALPLAQLQQPLPLLARLPLGVLSRAASARASRSSPAMRAASAAEASRASTMERRSAAIFSYCAVARPCSSRSVTWLRSSWWHCRSESIFSAARSASTLWSLATSEERTDSARFASASGSRSSAARSAAFSASTGALVADDMLTKCNRAMPCVVAPSRAEKGRGSVSVFPHLARALSFHTSPEPRD